MSAVATITDGDARRRLERLREALVEALPVRRGGRYVIKPNLSSCRPSSTGATTDLPLVQAIARHVQDGGARVGIVELPPHVRNTARVVSLTGYGELARELGIELVVPDTRREFVSVGRLFGALPIRVARAAWEADGIINVPKVKTHMRAHFTAAVKNLMGLADMATRHWIHVLGLHPGIVALYRALEPRIVLNVLDAIVAMEGQGPTRGDPLPLDTIMVARDAVAADLAAAARCGIELDRVRYLAQLAAGQHAPGPHEALAAMVPVHNPHPLADYVREALITQPLLRRLLQRIDFDFLTDKRPVLPAGGPPLDHLCPHGAIRGTTLLAERCTFCYECIGPDSPVVLERGLAHKARILRELARVHGGA